MSAKDRSATALDGVPLAAAGAGVAGASAGDDVVGAADGVDVDGAGAGVEAVGGVEGFAGAGDWALVVIQFHQPKGQEAAPAGAVPAVSSPPARTRVVKGAAICLLSSSIRRTVPIAYVTPHIE